MTGGEGRGQRGIRRLKVKGKKEKRKCTTKYRMMMRTKKEEEKKEGEEEEEEEREEEQEEMRLSNFTGRWVKIVRHLDIKRTKKPMI